MMRIAASTGPMLNVRASRKNNNFLTLLAIPVFVTLHNLNEFRDLMFATNILLLVISWLLVPLVVFFVIKQMTRFTHEQSLLLSFYLTACFFFFGGLQDFLIRTIPVRFYSKSYFIVSLFFIIPFAFYIFLKKVDTRRVISYFSKLCFVLIIYESILLCILLIRSDSYHAISRAFKQEQIHTKSNTVVSQKPDIYHFIFDSYTNSQALKKFWNYLNPLDSFLTDRGFHVVPGSISNYDFTPFSIGSVFNLQYLSASEKYLGRNGKNYYIGRMAFMDNEVFKILEANDYTLNNFSLLDTIKYLQRLGTFGPQKPLTWLRNQTLERLYLNPWLKHKVLHKFYRAPLPDDITRSYEAYIDYHRRVVSYFTTSLANPKYKKGPNFYLMHFFIPHEPYLFDETGNVRSLATKPDDMDGYLGQIKFANMLIKQIVSKLLNDSKKKIIIIQGDHGYRNSEPGMIRTDQFSCFNAIYFYDSNYKDFYKGMSLVNTYRIVLNKYFNYDLPIIKDSIFLNR